jgi:hypothetical protein
MDIKDVFKLLREVNYDSELTHAEKVILTTMTIKMDNATETVKASQQIIYNNCGVSKKAYYAMIKKNSVKKYFTIKKIQLDRVEIKMKFPAVTNEFPAVTNEFPEETPRKHNLPATFYSTDSSTESPKETDEDSDTQARAARNYETQRKSPSIDDLLSFLNEMETKWVEPLPVEKKKYFNEPIKTKYDV